MTKTNEAIFPIESVLEIYLFILEEHPCSIIILSTCTGLPLYNTSAIFAVFLLGNATFQTTILAKIPWNNRTIAFFIPNHHKNYYPPLPHSMLKKLAGNTTGIFVNTHFNSEMAEWGELKSHVSIFLSKVYLSQHFWRRL